MAIINWTHTYNIIYSEPLVVPENIVNTVTCVLDAVEPDIQNIIDGCGVTITPSLIGYVDTPNPIISDGTRVWTYQYEDRKGTKIEWTYTYNIVYGELTIPENISSTVVLDDAVNLIPQNVIDSCNTTIIPSLIGCVDTPDPIISDGTRVWTYQYEDREGTIFEWTNTYNIRLPEWLTWGYDPFETLLNVDELVTKVFT